MDNNAYLLQGPDGATVLIDAANDERPAAQDHRRRAGSTPSSPPTGTVTTGRRWRRSPRPPSAQLVAGRPDVDAIATGAWVEDLVGVWDGDQVDLGTESLEVIGLVGHTPGSITLAYAGGGATHLFTGDSLFPGGPGKTNDPEDFTSLMDDLEAKMFAPLRRRHGGPSRPRRRHHPGCGASAPGEWRTARGW